MTFKRTHSLIVFSNCLGEAPIKYKYQHRIRVVDDFVIYQGFKFNHSLNLFMFILFYFFYVFKPLGS